jgi:putative MATE family efflux protein
VREKKLEADADRALLLRLAAPSYVAQAMDPIAAAVDLFWIGRLGSMPLAGAAVASAVFNSIVYLFGYLSFTTNAVVARAVATANPEERAASMARAAASSVVLALYVGILVATPIFLFAPRLVAIMGAQSRVMVDAVGYLRSRALGMPFLIVFFALNGVFRGLADLSRPLFASVFGNIINVILDPILMFGPLAMGTFGAGIATSIACLVTVGYLFVYLLRSGLVPLQAWFAALRVSKNDIAVVLGPFLALSMKRILENGALALASSRAARIGPAASAAMEIARQVWWTIGVLWWPLCTAVAAVTSIAVAQRSDKSRISSIAALALKLTGILGLLGGLGTALLANYIPLLFLKDRAFLSASIEGLRVLAPFLAVSSVMDALDYVLIAGGDGLFNTVTTGLSVIAAGLWLTRIGTVSGIWIALLVSYVVRLVFNIARFRRLYGG